MFMDKYYTYAYLKEDLSPYYIGVGCGDRAYRHCNSYDCPAPDPEYIQILKSGLTQEQAWEHERYLIWFFGRMFEGGLLRNKARGGSGWGGGSPATAERKRKISKANRGRTLTKEHRAKLSVAKTGRKQKPEAIAKRAKGCCRSITLIAPDGATLTFDSVNEASAFIGVSQSSISHLRSGRYKTVKGYSIP